MAAGNKATTSSLYASKVNLHPLHNKLVLTGRRGIGIIWLESLLTLVRSYIGEMAALCHLGITATAVEGEPCALDFPSNLGMLSSL